jgi:hypothetical protein
MPATAAAKQTKRPELRLTVEWDEAYWLVTHAGRPRLPAMGTGRTVRGALVAFERSLRSYYDDMRGSEPAGLGPLPLRDLAWLEAFYGDAPPLANERPD